MVYCSNCGAELDDSDDFCSACGEPVSTAPAEHSHANSDLNNQVTGAAGQHPESSGNSSLATEGDGVSRRDLVLGGTVVAIGGGIAAVAMGDMLPGSGSGGPPVSALEVNLSDIRLPSIGLTSATIPVVLSIQNTADTEIPSPNIQYSVLIDNVEVLSTTEAIATFDPGEQRSVGFDVVLEYADYGQSLVELVQSEEFSVTVTGEIESEGTSAEFSDSFRV